MTHPAKRLKNSNIFMFFCLMGGAYILYGQTFSFPWLYDDLIVIVQNSDIRSLTGFFRDTYPGRPLREITFLLDYAFFDLEPAGYHFQNIFWHGMNSIMVFLVTRQMVRASAVAWTAALVFLVHPLGVEVVVQASHRKDSLCLFFSLLSVYLYIKACFSERNRWALFVAAFAMAGVGFLAKIPAAMVPAAFLIVEFTLIPREKRFFLRRKGFAPIFWSIVALIAVIRVIFLVSSSEFLVDIKGAMAKMGELSSSSVESYYFMILKSHAFLFSKLIVPLNLSPEYTYPVPESLTDPWVLFGIFSIILFAAGLVYFAKRSPACFFAGSWMLLFWLPTSNIFGHYSYFAADRYLYSSTAGFAILVGLSLSLVASRALSFSIKTSVLFLLVFLNFQQQLVWSSEEAFVNNIVEVSPNSREGLFGRANIAKAEGRHEEALALLNEYLAYYKDDFRVYQKISNIYAETGFLDKAIFYAELALGLDNTNSRLHENLGILYRRAGQSEKSIKSLERALQLDPGNSQAYRTLGAVYLDRGDLDNASKFYLKSIEVLPHNPPAYYSLAIISYKQGDKSESLNRLRTAHDQAPMEPSYLYYLGMVAAELGMFDIAEEAADKLILLDPAKSSEVMKWIAVQKSSSSDIR